MLYSHSKCSAHKKKCGYAARELRMRIGIGQMQFGGFYEIINEV